MPDMLVKLYALPDLNLELARQCECGIQIRRAFAPERTLTQDWVGREFGDRWASQCSQSFSGVPPTCFIAIQEGRVVGFACYDSVFRSVFGPMGVLESLRGRGTGKALLAASLYAMREDGYIYAIIGQVGPADFYAKVGAVMIENSDPGMYTDLLR